MLGALSLENDLIRRRAGSRTCMLHRAWTELLLIHLHPYLCVLSLARFAAARMTFLLHETCDGGAIGCLDLLTQSAIDTQIRNPAVQPQRRQRTSLNIHYKGRVGQGWQGRWVAGVARRQKVATPAGSRGAANTRGR